MLVVDLWQRKDEDDAMLHSTLADHKSPRLLFCAVLRVQTESAGAGRARGRVNLARARLPLQPPIAP